MEGRTDRKSLEQLKTVLVRDLTFRGPIFDAFSARNIDPARADPEQAARYEVLLKFFRETKNPDERLRILAEWLWAELDQSPEDSLGKEAVTHLTSAVRVSLRRFPLNDFYYAHLVRTWLPYVERLFQDAQVQSGRRLKEDLLSLGYDKIAVGTYVSKTWRSTIEFTCQWLAMRGGIEMIKPREDTDMARTLRNAYSRIFGQGAPHLLECEFCGMSAVGDFYAEGHTSVSHCDAHGADQLPTSSSGDWTDRAGRRWWRDDKAIRCDLTRESS